MGDVQPHSRIEDAICATWASSCVRAFRAKESGVRQASVQLCQPATPSWDPRSEFRARKLLRGTGPCRRPPSVVTSPPPLLIRHASLATQIN
jgi:hypothetical protein